MSKLIYGKAGVDRIVSIEIENDQALLFQELADGTLDIKKVPNRFWILATRPFGVGWHRLEGDQDFKWGKQYTRYLDWQEARKVLPSQEIYSISNIKEAFQVKDGYCYYQGMRHDEPSILSFDIESTGLEHNDDSKIIVISNTFRKLGKVTRKLFCFNEYKNCAELVQAWADWVREVDPSVLCFHNGYSFDLPYIKYCHDRYSDEPIKLGRLDKGIHFSKFESKYRVDGSRDLHYHKCQVYGREIVDTMFLAYKYDSVEKKYESYGLKKIIAQEGLEKKDRVFYDANKIRFNYKDPTEFEKIKEYCKDDSDDALSLYDLMVAPTFYLTQSIPKPFQLVVESATGSQINSLLVRAYLQDKHSVAKADNLEDEKVEGGISFAVPGIYKNVFKVDIKSCYPSQILRFKLYEERKDPHAYYYKLVEHFTLQRYEYKKQMLATGDNYWKNLDAMAKIFINSSYGVANTSGLNYNSASIARKITLESRAIIDMSLRWASGFGYNHWAKKFYDAVGEKEEDRVYLSLPKTELKIKYKHDFIIAPTDTDSVSICKRDMSPFSQEEIKTLLDEINEQSPDKVVWENDGVYKTIIVIRAKNYVLYDEKKTKIRGSALKASGKCEALKEMIKEFIEIIIHNPIEAEMHEKLKQLYTKYVNEINNITDITRWAARKTISSTLMESERTNETKVVDALVGSNYVEGDRVRVFYMPDDSLCLVENFTGEYNKKRLLKNLFDTANVFQTVLPTKELFVNYSLIKNYKTLENLTSVQNDATV